MPVSLNSNVAALNVSHRLGRNQAAKINQMEAIGSGLRIRRAANDAAGLSVSEGLRSQLTRLGQNVRNAEQATDLLQTVEGSLGEATAILQRMRSLATQSSSGHLTNRDREVLSEEFANATAAIDRIAQATVYNGQVLLAGFAQTDRGASTAMADASDTGVAGVKLSGADVATYRFFDDAGDETVTLGNGTTTQTIDLGVLLEGGHAKAGTKIIANFDRLGIQVTLAGAGAVAPPDTGDYVQGDLNGKTIVLEKSTLGSFQVGPSVEDVDRIDFDLPDLRASGTLLDLDKTSLSSQGSSRAALGKIDAAINILSRERGRIGAVVKRLDHTIGFTTNAIENTQASEATIRDADMALASSRMARAQILSGRSSSMLAQAFVNSRQMLTLL